MFTVTKAGLIPMPINLCMGCIGAQQGNLRHGGVAGANCEKNHGKRSVLPIRRVNARENPEP